MATFDAFFPNFRRDLGLEVCPFNSNHKIKPSKYSKHVKKCEQLNPHLVRKVTACPPKSMFISIESLANTDDTGYVTSECNLSDSINSVTGFIDDWSDNNICSQITNDNNISVNDSAINILDEHNVVVDEVVPTSCINESNNDIQNDVLTLEENLIDLTPVVNNDYTNTAQDCNDWNCGQPYSLIDTTIDYNNLCEDQMRQLIANGVDTIILCRLNKSQRKKFYQLMIAVKAESKELKNRAINELVAIKDNQKTDIDYTCDDIRKPRTHINDLFKNLKIKNNKNDTSNKMNINLATNETVSDKTDERDGKFVEIIRESMPTTDKFYDIPVIDCNSCDHKITLTPDVIKQMKIWCYDCSAVKFGGFFECQSCQLCGYLSEPEMKAHLNKHFPHININH